LSIEVQENFLIRMKGPVRKVADGHIDPECLHGVV
jgi:hypothetical protein